MKKLIVAFLVVFTTACGPVYLDALKQIQLGMSEDQVVGLMGKKYTVVEQNGQDQTIEYVDKYKNEWFFQFQNDKLVKWYKQQEQKPAK